LNLADRSQPDIIEESIDLFVLLPELILPCSYTPASAPTVSSGTLRSKVCIIPSQVQVLAWNPLIESFTAGPADRLLIYLILFISECLTKLASTPGRPSPGYQEATKVLSTLSVDTFALPGDAGFPLNSLYHAPASRVDAGLYYLPRSRREVDVRRPDALRSYLTQTRQELANRLCDRMYPPEQQIGADGQNTGLMGPRPAKPCKWWMSFQKKR